MKVELLRDRLSYEQEMVDWLNNWHPANREDLLEILKRELDEKRTAGGDRLINFEFHKNGNVVLLNNSY
ncbi:hypothetical protein [Larkinella humicola]|uniref:Uncharacterized protein n=1 Tax=Larkinella humicola TaxID=2607654 RepID=A0A5N1JL94_9BACT|nr:hypothetical protein [Larkinella humicola]KAA9357260.1 hypothetical protein F0P93_05860 [Larkinella humicola]